MQIPCLPFESKTVGNIIMVSLRRKAALRCWALHKILSLHHKRRYWVHPINKKRDFDGEHVKVEEMYRKYPEKFFQYTRMSPEQFDKLYFLVASEMQKNDTNYRKCIPARHRLFVILRYLSTGDSLRTVATNFSMGMTTVWKIVRLDLPQIWKCLKSLYLKCPGPEDWKRIAQEFETTWNYPNLLGAIDGKHVQIQAPAHSGSLYHNYKGTFSIVLMATCDANYCFTTIDVGAYGKQSDGGIFSTSKLGTMLQEGTLNIPEPKNLPGTNISVPFHFVGDEAFPLTGYMMRPYPSKNLTDEMRIFNYRLSRARRCIENSFGILASRWRIFGRVILAAPRFVEDIVLAAVVLHNFIQTEEGKLPLTQRQYCPPGYADSNGEENGAWRRDNPGGGLLDITSLTVAAHERFSKSMRDDLKRYFNGIGQVEWQNERAGINWSTKLT